MRKNKKKTPNKWVWFFVAFIFTFLCLWVVVIDSDVQPTPTSPYALETYAVETFSMQLTMTEQYYVSPSVTPSPTFTPSLTATPTQTETPTPTYTPTRIIQDSSKERP